MATYEELMNAARNAHAAGDEAAARQLVQSATRMNSRDFQRDFFADRIAAAKSGGLPALPPERQQQQNRIDQIGEDRMIIAATGGEIPNAARQFTTGLPFVGSYADEVAGALFGEQAGERYRNSVAAYERENPVASTALQVTGGVSGSVPALAAAPAVAGGGPLVAQALRLGGTSAVAGAVEGGIYGAGDQSGEGRAANAAQNAVIGGGVGGVLGAGAPLAVEGVQQGIQALRRTPERQVAQEIGVSPEATRLLTRVTGMEDPAQMAANLQRSGPGAMLADSGDLSSGVLDTALQTPGGASRTGRQRVEDRASAAMAGINQALDETLGTPQGLISIGGDIRQAAQPEVRAAYARAYDTPVDYSSDAGRKIEGIFRRIPNRTKSQAIQAAQERMTYDGVPGQIMASIADDGSVTFQRMPGVQELDYIKRAFDGIVRNGTDPISGQMDDNALFASRIARDIRDATKEAVPAYGEALNLAADSITTQNAVDIGAQALSPQFTRERLVRAVDGASDAEMRALRAGLRSRIDETLANVRAVASDRNVDARQARQALSEMSSDAAKAKIRTILPMDQANRLLGQLDEASQALALRSSVATNSRTMGRQVTNEFISDVTEPGAITSALQGSPINAAQRIVQGLTGTTPGDMTARQQQILAEVTDVLTRSGQPQAQRVLQLLENVRQGQPLSEGQARLVAGITTSLLGSTADQSALQLTGLR